MVGQKFAREIFFLGRTYSRRGHAPDGRGQHRRRPRRAGGEALEVAREIMGKSPTAQRMLKFAFNLSTTG